MPHNFSSFLVKMYYKMGHFVLHHQKIPSSKPITHEDCPTLSNFSLGARHAYNWGLELCKKLLNYNRENPHHKLKFPSAIDLHKLLVSLVKPQKTWYYEVSKCAPQYALRQLRQAFADFFNKKRINGKPVGFPRFKKKSRHNSFTLDGSIKVVDHFKIKVPVIGVLKTYERLPHGFLPKNVTISRQADRWFISYKLKV